MLLNGKVSGEVQTLKCLVWPLKSIVETSHCRAITLNIVDFAGVLFLLIKILGHVSVHTYLFDGLKC